jgi:hypothetical protein
MCLDQINCRAEEMPPAMVGYKVVRKQNYHTRLVDLSIGPIGKANRLTPTTALVRSGYLPDLMNLYIFGPKEDGQGWAMLDDAQPIACGLSDIGESYLPGVHAYSCERDAQHFCQRTGRDDYFFRVVKVYLRGPIAAGTQYGYPVVVYREMTILAGSEED